jgi:ABC-type nitrate/sulfonate/bicarbonate transport system substrate-binding protein
LAFATLILILFALNPIAARSADKLRISYSGTTTSNALLWVTKEAKLFEKNGIDAEVLYLAGSLGQTALIASETQFAVYTGLLMTPSRLQGADVTMIAGFLNYLVSRLVVRADIKSTADLKGKRLGVTRFGTASDFGTRLSVAKLGLNPNSDVIILQIGDTPTRVAALMAKSIDGALFDPPDHQRAIENGGRVMVNLEDSKAPYQHAGMMTTRKYIASRPDIVRRVVKAIVEGASVVRRDPETTKRALSIRMRIKDAKELAESYQQLRGFTQAKPYPSLEGFRQILNDLAPRMAEAKNADPRDFFDGRFIEELDRTGYIDGL